jgi:hypothetical protein
VVVAYGLATTHKEVVREEVQGQLQGNGTSKVAQAINQLYQINMLETTEIQVVAPQLVTHRYMVEEQAVVVPESQGILLEDTQAGVMAAMV